jgi:hypothetical protein
LNAGGCGSVHIGGGEPFLDFEGLLMAVRTLRHAGIALEYVETNAYWAQNEDEARKKLERLQAEGADTLCISLDPFHAEYVPYGYPLRLYDLCGRTGMGAFLWKPQYAEDLSGLDPRKTHTSAEMKETVSAEYIGETAKSYGIRFGGRAVTIEREYAPSQPAEELLDDAPCAGLLSGGHFHADMLGYFIPPGCTGLRLPLAEAVNGIPPEKYPAFEALYYRGIRGLWDYAAAHGFTADIAGYPSKCNLCFHIRRHLSGQTHPELDPEHYEAVFSFF